MAEHVLKRLDRGLVDPIFLGLFHYSFVHVVLVVGSDRCQLVFNFNKIVVRHRIPLKFEQKWLM